MGKCKAIIIILMLAVTCVAAAQSEVNGGKILSGDSLRVERNIQDIDSIFTEQDSSILFKPVMPTSITKAATNLITTRDFLIIGEEVGKLIPYREANCCYPGEELL